MSHCFHTPIIRSGNAYAIEVPLTIRESLGSEARPPICIMINGHRWRGRVLVGINNANLRACGSAVGDEVAAELTCDDESRDLNLPADVIAAMTPILRNLAPLIAIEISLEKIEAAFSSLPFGIKRKQLAFITNAKSEPTKQRRIVKLLTTLNQDQT